MRLKLFVQLFLFVAVCATVCAQTSGSLTGVVFDASQAVIPAAKVLAENVSTGQKREAKTNSAGRYTIPDLAIGTYKISAEMTGFQAKIYAEIQIGVAQSANLDITLTTGTVSNTIEVTGNAPALEGITGAEFNTKALVDLPINGRDYARFSLLTPGAVASSNYIAMLTFNGQQSIHTSFKLTVWMQRA